MTAPPPATIVPAAAADGPLDVAAVCALMGITPEKLLADFGPHDANHPLVLALADRLGARHVFTNTTWAKARSYWTCPSCGRWKWHIPRVALKTGRLVAAIHSHHDHAGNILYEVLAAFREDVGDDYGPLNEKWPGVHHIETCARRFNPTDVCEDCNNADTVAKKIVGAPADFSFSPLEIRGFVRGPGPHRKHVVNEPIAFRLWNEARRQHERRRRFVEWAVREHFAGRLWFRGPYYGARDDSENPIFRVMNVEVAMKGELAPPAPDNDPWPPPIGPGPLADDIPFDPFPEDAP